MTRYDVPRDEQGRRVCEQCHDKPVPASLGTKPRRYCSVSCKQRAYEARKVREAIVASVAVAVAKERADGSSGKSRDFPDDPRVKSRDFADGSQVTAPIPAPTAEAAPAASPVKPPLPPVPKPSRRRSGMTASPMPSLFDVERKDADGR